MPAAQNGHLKGLIGPEENLGEKAWRTYLKPAFSRSHRNINKYTFLSPFFDFSFLTIRVVRFRGPRSGYKPKGKSLS